MNSAYIAFDVYPSHKGAATHIERMAHCLFEHTHGGALITLGTPNTAAFESEGNISCHRLTRPIPNFLERTQTFSGFVDNALAQYPSIDIVHFRDIWSAMGAIDPRRNCRYVFEVNGLPSIELIYHYPELSKSLQQKLVSLEDYCLARSDAIVVPSHIIKSSLIKRGVASERISVVPNGADPKPIFSDENEELGDYLIYFGAMQPWQGVDTLLKAFALLKDKTQLRLMMCCVGKPRHYKQYQRLARRLDIEKNVIWRYQLSKPELNTYINNALISVAPLSECDRNLNQGCSPLKIFESMACKTPIVASELPVVEEILQDNVDAKLVKPDRPAELARAIRLLLEHPDLRARFAENAYQKIVSTFNWQQSTTKLIDVYKSL